MVNASNVKVENSAAGTITSTMGDIAVNAETGMITITTGTTEE